jgi:hypothetical protein
MKNIYSFIHIEKCAGTSILKILTQLYGAKHIDAIPRDIGSMNFSQQDLIDLQKVAPFVRSISSGHSMRPYIDYDPINDSKLIFYTILRNPIQRYISDFKHFADLTNFPKDFDAWLGFEERKNFIVKSISGSEDVESAKRIINSKFALVGILEEYELFKDGLAKLLGVTEIRDLRINTNTSAQRGGNYKNIFFEKHMEKIIENNALDIELYEYIKDDIERFSRPKKNKQPEQQHIRNIKTINEFLYRIFRTAIYKPYMGHSPLKRHALPIYSGYRK